MLSQPLEAQFQFRHFNAETDIPRLASLLEEIENIDHTGEDISEETLKAQLTWPGHNPSQDRQVVMARDDPGQMIGFSSVWKVPQNIHADIFVGVHPLWRKKGIGSALLQGALARAQTLHPHSILAYADAQHQEAMHFLQERAFSPAAAYTAMRCASDKLLPQSAWPAGYTIRVYNPSQDFPLLLDMYNRSFQGLWGHWETVMAEDLHGILEDQNAADNFLLFAPTGEVVGTCRGTISEPLSTSRGKRMGYLDCPGVVPEHRANGLYLPLLLHAAQWVRNQGATDIEVESWGDDPQVLAQYQQVGFEKVHQQIIYCLSCQ